MNKSLLTLTLLFCGMFVFQVSTTIAQSERKRSPRKWDPTEYLNRLDKNKNGSLEPDEVSGKSRTFLKSVGVDMRRPMGIKYIAGRIEKHTADSVQKKKDEELSAQRKKDRKEKYDVPGFETEPVERLGVPDFSGAMIGMSREVMIETFGAETIREVDKTIEQYDKNKDGVLSMEEIKKARWGKPTPQESDTNRDGKLTRLEIAVRYQTREDAKSDGRSSRRRSSRDDDSSKSKDGRPDLKSRLKNFDVALKQKSNLRDRISRSRNSKVSISPSSKSKKTTKKFNSGRDKYQRYADGLIAGYDRNKDGKLSKDEVSKMRSPPKNADSNRDGYITRSELVSSVSNQNTTKSDRSSGLKKSRSTFRDSKSSGSRRSSSPGKFDELDTNQDGQIQMSEYASPSDWTSKIVAEFKAKDTDDDGIISLEEWNGPSS